MPSQTAARADPALIDAPDAVVTLFGHDPSPARLRLRVRSRGWRARRAAAPALVGLVVTPVVALLPPHVPWALTALAVGAFLARRSWTTRYTVESFEASCPRCGAPLELAPGSRLRFPHPLHCDECRHEPVLEVDAESLAAGTEGRG